MYKVTIDGLNNTSKIEKLKIVDEQYVVDKLVCFGSEIKASISENSITILGSTFVGATEETEGQIKIVTLGEDDMDASIMPALQIASEIETYFVGTRPVRYPPLS